MFGAIGGFSLFVPEFYKSNPKAESLFVVVSVIAPSKSLVFE